MNQHFTGQHSLAGGEGEPRPVYGHADPAFDPTLFAAAEKLAPLDGSREALEIRDALQVYDLAHHLLTCPGYPAATYAKWRNLAMTAERRLRRFVEGGCTRFGSPSPGRPFDK